MTASSSTDSTAHMRALFEKHYAHLGTVLSIAPLDVAVVSSRLFLVRTHSGAFCLKVPLYERVIGEAQETAHANWLLIHDLRARLLDRGVPVEEVVASSSGHELNRADNHLFWATPYYPNHPFEGHPEELTLAGAALGQFHCEGHAIVQDDDALAARVRTRLVRDMPLAESLDLLPDLMSTLFDDHLYETHPHCQPLRDTMEAIRHDFDATVVPVCRWAVQQLPEIVDGDAVLTHNDFHPANLLFLKDGGIRILDLEHVTVGPRLKCLALAVSRFTTEACRIRPALSLSRAVAALLDGYRREGYLTSADEALIPDWIRFYETEKILRILRRFLLSGQYPAMVRKIVSHHMPACQNADEFWRAERE